MRLTASCSCLASSFHAHVPTVVAFRLSLLLLLTTCFPATVLCYVSSLVTTCSCANAAVALRLLWRERPAFSTYLCSIGCNRADGTGRIWRHVLSFVTGPRRIARGLMQMSTADISKDEALRFLAPYSAQGEFGFIQATAVSRHTSVCFRCWGSYVAVRSV